MKPDHRRVSFLSAVFSSGVLAAFPCMAQDAKPVPPPVPVPAPAIKMDIEKFKVSQTSRVLNMSTRSDDFSRPAPRYEEKKFGQAPYEDHFEMGDGVYGKMSAGRFRIVVPLAVPR